MLCPEADRPPTQEKHLHHRRAARTMSSPNQGQLLLPSTALHLCVCVLDADTPYRHHARSDTRTAACRPGAMLASGKLEGHPTARERFRATLRESGWQDFKFSRWVSSSLPLLVFYESLVAYLRAAAKAAICYLNCAPAGRRCNRRPAAANVCSVIWSCRPPRT